MGWTLRPVETGPNGLERGWGSWEGSSEPPPHQLGGVGSAVSSPSGVRGSGAVPGKFGFWSILGPQKSRQNGQLAFESGGGEQVNLGGRARASLTQRRSAPV